MGLAPIGTIGACPNFRSQSHFRIRIAQLTGPFVQDQFHAAAAAGAAAAQQLHSHPPARCGTLRLDPPPHVGPGRLSSRVAGADQ